MSKVRADQYTNKEGTGAPSFPNGVNVTGILTATGGFSGNATSATTATTANTATVAVNAQGLTGTPNISVGTIGATGNLTGTTAAFSGNLTGTTAAFSGNVSVGGTLTYADVTNIDSVGIVTARSGIKVLAGGTNTIGSQTGNIVAMGANAVDCSQGNYFTKTISGATTFTFTNVPSGVEFSFTMEVTLNGSNSITWPSSVKWNADTAPTLTDGKTQLFMFVTTNGGTRFRGSALVDYVN
tara:strand:+ start:180 stop:899 length:720 start_codon:yes stop_codon:yes gene_type:complete